MSRRVLCASLSLLLVAVALSTFAAAGTISYSETFQTTGEQATTGGPFKDYSAWTFQPNNTVSIAKVDTVGTLQLTLTSDSWSAMQAYITAQSIAGSSAFDVSSMPLTVSAKIAGSSNSGSDSPGLLIGNVMMRFYSNLNIVDLTNLTTGDQHRTENIVPGFGAYPNSFYDASVTVQEDSTHQNYLFKYSVGDFESSWTFAKSAVGSLEKVGFYMEGNFKTSTGYFQNFTVSQVPEPSTTVLVGTGIAGLLCYAWRKRR